MGYSHEDMVDDLSRILKLRDLREKQSTQPNWLQRTQMLEAARDENRQQQQEFQAQQKELENQKFVVGKWIDLWKQAPTEAMREHYFRTIQDMEGGLDPTIRQALAPILNMGPTGEVEQKKREFVLHAGARPGITVDPSVDRRHYAEQLFDQQDWDIRQQIFVGGKESAPTPKNFISLGEGFYAIRDKDGATNIVDDATLNLNKLAEDNKTTAAKIIANNGRIMGDPVRMSIDGQEVELRPYTTVTDMEQSDELDEKGKSTGKLVSTGRYRLDKSGIETVFKGVSGEPGEVEKRKQQAADITSLLANDQKNMVVQAVANIQDSSGVDRVKAVKSVLRQKYPGTFFHVEEGKSERGMFEFIDKAVDWYKGIKGQLSIYAVPGVPTEVKTRDKSIMLVKDKLGQYRTEYGVLVPEAIMQKMPGLSNAEAKTVIENMELLQR